MEWKGREYNFELNIQSEIEIAKLCPDEDFAKIGDVLSNGTFTQNVMNIIKIACALSKAYEEHRAYDNPEYVPQYLQEDDFRFATMDVISVLSEQITEAMNRDMKVSIETEEPKGKKTEEESSLR